MILMRKARQDVGARIKRQADLRVLHYNPRVNALTEQQDHVHLSFSPLLSAPAVQRRNCISEATRPRGHGVISIRLHYKGDIWVVKIGSS
jgi:hypothetical protein